MENQNDLLAALEYVRAGNLTYDEWTAVGMGLKEAGLPCSVWDDWSRDDKRYVEGDCARRWATFKGSDRPITVRTIRAMARKNGWVSAFTDFEDTRELAPTQTLIRYLEAMFQPDELVGYATQVKPDNHGKLKPINTNLAMKASEFIDRLRDAESIEAVIGPYRADCGAWIRLNPLDGKGQSDRNVAVYRHVLIEKNFPHHGAVAFGHYGKALFEVFKYLGVADIGYNQPKSLPYPSENPFNK